MIGPLSFLPLEDAQEKGRGLGTAAEQEASGGGSTLGGGSGSLPYVREQGRCSLAILRDHYCSDDGSRV